MVEIAIPPGVSRGATPADRPNRWYDSNLMRFRDDGRLEPMGGWTRITVDPLDVPPRRLFAWRDAIDVRRLAVGSDNGLYLLTGAVYQNITPNGFTTAGNQSGLPDGWGIGDFGAGDWGTPREQGSVAYLRASPWSLDNFGEDLLACAAFDGRLYHYTRNSTLQQATLVATAPISNKAMLVTPERHVLLVGSGGQPRTVAWSSRETFTDWNFASLTNTAGELPINCDGLLWAAAPVRDGTLLFSDTEVHLLRYVDVPEIYGSFRVGSEVNLLSANAIAVFSGNAVWLGRSSFYIYDGGQAVRVLPCEVASEVFAEMDYTNAVLRAHASASGIFSEVTFFYPTKAGVAAGSGGECDAYVTWNYATGTWVRGRLTRTAMFPAGIYPFPILATAHGHLYQHEDGPLEAGVPRPPGRCWIESAAFAAGDGRQTLDAMSAQMDSGANYDRTNLRLIGRMTRDGPEYQEDYVPREDGYTDTRFTARDVRVRISNATADMAWSIGRFRVEVEPGSER